MSPNTPMDNIHLDLRFTDAADLAAITTRLDAIALAATITPQPDTIPAPDDFEPTSHAIAATIRHLPGGGMLQHVTIESDITPDLHRHEWTLLDHPAFRDMTFRTLQPKQGQDDASGSVYNAIPMNDAEIIARYAKLFHAATPTPHGHMPNPCEEIHEAIAIIVGEWFANHGVSTQGRVIDITHPTPFSPGQITISEDAFNQDFYTLIAPDWMASLPMVMRLVTNDRTANVKSKGSPLTINLVEGRFHSIEPSQNNSPMDLLRAHALLPGDHKIVITNALDEKDDA